MRRKKTGGAKACVMFGFRGDETGYLALTESGKYLISQDMAEASRFSLEKDRKGWAPPSKWAEFFNAEDELSGWRFHTVAVTS